MKRHDRTRVLIEGDRGVVRTMVAETEAAFPVTVLDEPQECLVMVKVRESAQRSLFYLGEALMTACRVSIEGVQGLGMVLGSDRDLAYDLAVVDAAFSLDDGRLDRRPWEAAMAAEEARLTAAAAARRAVVGATRVDFSTMEEEL